MLPANDPMVAKKSPKRTKMPYNSTIKPVRGHLTKMRIMPAENAAVPLIFSFRAKNTNVFWRPMMRVRPITNRIYPVLAAYSKIVSIFLTLPIASKDRSKNIKTPSVRNNPPPAQKATPISNTISGVNGTACVTYFAYP